MECIYNSNTSYSYLWQILNYIYIRILCVNVCASLTFINRQYNSDNKHPFKQYKSFLCTLLQNMNHDAVSGWLILASFFYKTKQYSKAIHIIMYSISKWTDEKLHRFMDISDMRVRLFDLQVFQIKSIVLMLKVLLVDLIKFTRNYWLIPMNYRWR